MKSNPKPKVITHWEPIKGKPSPVWSRLWHKLLTDKRGRPAGTGEATENGEERAGSVK